MNKLKFLAAFILVLLTLSALAAQVHKTLYRCSMHPQVVREEPGNCPICHMRLEKILDQGEEVGEPSGVPGKAGFTLSPGRQQLIGVRWTPARIQEVGQTLRLPARVSGGREVLAELLEMDGGKVRTGTRAVLRGPEGKQVQAVVVSVDESLDNLSHTYSLRLRTPKAESWMRPGAYCLALVPSGSGKALAVPQEAVLDTGNQQVVFVVQDKGRFEPRLVVLGRVGDDVVEVLSGLKEGEQVVTSANFLIDSESRFKAALSNY